VQLVVGGSGSIGRGTTHGRYASRELTCHALLVVELLVDCSTEGHISGLSVAEKISTRDGHTGVFRLV
jgi:hypothetical protein